MKQPPQILKVYADRSFLPPGKQHTIMLYPFWGLPAEDPSDPDSGRFDAYVREGRQIFSITVNAEEADVFLLPFEYSSGKEELNICNQLSLLAGRHGKKLLVFYNSDSDEKISIQNAVILRTSFYKSRQNADEFALPGWSRDFGVKAAEEKPEKPCISYCGYIDYLPEGFPGSLKRWLAKPAQPGPRVRGAAVRALMKEKRIESRFIIRDGFWAAGMDKKQAREQYEGNMKSSDYALVARGAGNFSYRLYEALSCGVIPVFINTDSVLPFDQLIDWKRSMLWIEQEEIARLPEKLLAFHQGLSTEEFNAMKKNCRELYENWISPTGYFSSLHKIIR